MPHDPLSDIVSDQYEHWVYPEPIIDLPAWLSSHWEWYDPQHAYPIFWPNRKECGALDILVAGCGTNQAAIIAYTNPRAKITAIDVSASSLNHHTYLKERYALDNLEIHRLPIEQLDKLGRDFDLIISTGVLHHLANPQKGLDALARALRTDGVIALMLYARYGRIGVEMLQSLFRDLGLQQSKVSLQLIKDALSTIPGDHPLRSYINIAPDLQYDTGLVDTFLHGRERSFTITECIDFVEASGLAFQDLFFKSPYYPSHASTSTFLTFVSQLADQDQWSIMERIYHRNACHFFLATRTDRATETYKIAFDLPTAHQYKPALRHRCDVGKDSIRRADWEMPLSISQIVLAKLIDGDKTIQDIARTAINIMRQEEPYEGLLEATLDFIHSLWKLDFVSITFPPKS